VEENQEEFDRQESSVITEVVEEKIIEIESDAVINDQAFTDTKDRNQQIDEYLSMDKEEYVNKDEYSIEKNTDEKEDFGVKEEHLQDGIYVEEEKLSRKNEKNYEGEHYIENQEDYQEVEENSPENREESEEKEEVKHAGLQTIFIDEKFQHILNYVVEGYEPEQAIIDVDPEEIEGQHQNFGASPIQENEDEQYSTNNFNYPDLEDRNRLYQLANEVKKRDQGRKFVLWETNEIRNNWEEKVYTGMKKSVSLAKLEHHWNNDIERKVNSPKSKASAFDYSNIEEQNLPVVKPNRWYDGIESRVPLLSDHNASKKRMKSKRIEPGNSLKKVPRKNHALSNVFNQSDLQAQLETNKEQNKAPLTHKSLNKRGNQEKNLYAGRPIFGGNQPGSHIANGNAGRSRDFYSSFIF